MSPGTAAALLPLSLPPFIVSTREPRALGRPADGGKDTAAFALSRERLLQLHRKLGPVREGRQFNCGGRVASCVGLGRLRLTLSLR